MWWGDVRCKGDNRWFADDEIHKLKQILICMTPVFGFIILRANLVGMYKVQIYISKGWHSRDHPVGSKLTML
jgi:hypothetical protein